MQKAWLANQYLAFICFKRFLLGKARWENKVVKCVLPFLPTGESTVYLLVNKRDRATNYKYEISVPKVITIFDKTIYVFATILEKEVVFYGWLTGEKLKNVRIYHPVGETKIYYTHGGGDEDVEEEKQWVNKWEHYGVPVIELNILPEIKNQQSLTSFISSVDEKTK